MSKAVVYGHFGSKQALQLQTIRYAQAKFLQDIITPARAVPDGVPRLWEMCAALLAYAPRPDCTAEISGSRSSTNTPTAAARYVTRWKRP